MPPLPPDPRNASNPAWLQQTAEPRPAPDNPALLDRVLQQTCGAILPDEPLSEADRQAVQDVVCRHRGQPLSLVPVATNLVHALLKSQFQGVESFALFGQALAGRVAQALMEDPAASARLGVLWDRLSGGKP
ncbi:MAG: hypothetical protein ACLQNE_00765 [Thermoguttaceae bacterium]